MSQAIFGLLGVFVGAFLTWFKEEWAERRTRSRHACYLAIRVVCVLDKYVEGCAEVTVDDGLCYGQLDKDGNPSPQVEEPDSPTYPADIDWKSIDHDLMYKILAFPNEVDAANRAIRSACEFGGPDDIFQERRYQYARLGLVAVGIAERLRNMYGIHPLTVGDWDPIEHLRSSKEQIDKIRRDRQNNPSDIIAIEAAG